MVRFWVWGVRNPALLLAGLATAAALADVADDAIAYTLLLGFGIVAESANHLGRRARARQQRDRAARAALEAATALRESFHHRKAA